MAQPASAPPTSLCGRSSGACALSNALASTLPCRLHTAVAGRSMCSADREIHVADQYRFARFIHAVDGKQVLGRIDSDGDNWHGLPLLLVLMKFRHSIVALRCRLAASAAAPGQGSPFHSDRSGRAGAARLGKNLTQSKGLVSYAEQHLVRCLTREITNVGGRSRAHLDFLP